MLTINLDRTISFKEMQTVQKEKNFDFFQCESIQIMCLTLFAVFDMQSKQVVHHVNVYR